MSCSVHDLAEYEAYGVPAVLVASAEFTTATAAQARSLGTEPAAVYVPHPIQDRTDDELHAIAADALDALLAAITAG